MASRNNFFNRGLRLVAYYKFNNNLIDEISGNNGTGTNISYNVGSFGNEVVFNGSNAYVDVADNDVFSFTDGVNDLPFRIELIVKLDSDVQQYLINKRTTGSFEWQIFQLNDSFRVILGNVGATSVISSSVSIAVVSGNYYNIIVEYDGSKTQNGLKIKVNGVSNIPNPSNPTYLGMANTISDVFIGRSGNGGRYLNGAISQIKIYK